LCWCDAAPARPAIINYGTASRSACRGKAEGGVVVAGQESYLSPMTTLEKTDAIQKIVTNHKDNVTAAQAANISAGLDALVIEAMNDSLKTDLTVVFALRSVAPGRG